MSKQCKRKAIIICLFIFLMSSPKAIGAQAVHIAVSPLIREIISKPMPNLIDFNLTLENKSNNSQHLTLTLKQAREALDDTFISIEPEDNSYKNIFNNITIHGISLNNQELILQPFEKKKLSIDIKIDKTIAYKDYYFVIFSSVKGTQLKDTSSSSVNIEIGSVVLLSFKTETANKAFIQQFSTNPFFFNGSVPFRLEVSNKSNSLTNASGTIYIKDMLGSIVAKLPIEDTILLAHTKRFIKAANSKQDTIVWNSNLKIGIYTAVANINIGDHLLQNTTYFVYIPTPYILSLIGICAFISGIYLKVRKTV